MFTCTGTYTPVAAGYVRVQESNKVTPGTFGTSLRSSGSTSYTAHVRGTPIMVSGRRRHYERGHFLRHTISAATPFSFSSLRESVYCCCCCCRCSHAWHVTGHRLYVKRSKAAYRHSSWYNYLASGATGMITRQHRPTLFSRYKLDGWEWMVSTAIHKALRGHRGTDPLHCRCGTSWGIPMAAAQTHIVMVRGAAAGKTLEGSWQQLAPLKIGAWCKTWLWAAAVQFVPIFFLSSQERQTATALVPFDTNHLGS